MTTYIEKSDLRIATELDELLNQEILPGLGLDADQLWEDFSVLIHDLAPVNQALLSKRDDIQQQIDDWHRTNPGSIEAGAAAVQNFTEKRWTDGANLLRSMRQQRKSALAAHTDSSPYFGLFSVPAPPFRTKPRAAGFFCLHPGTGKTATWPRPFGTSAISTRDFIGGP